MHARKELEEIHKYIAKKEVLNYALLTEIAFVLIGFSMDNIFGENDTGNTVSVVWLVASLIALVLMVMYWVYYAIKLRREEKLRKYLKNTKEIIDAIDNKLCYYLMTAQSMFDMGVATTSEKEKFHLIETSYYLNKCVSILASVDKNLLSALSPGNEEKDYRSGKISEARITNIIELMKSLYCNIEEQTKGNQGDEVIKRIHNENAYFRRRLDLVQARLKGTMVDKKKTQAEEAVVIN